MLSQISWSVFLGTSAVILVLYYTLVGMVYYPKQILNLAFGKFKQKADDVVVNRQLSAEGIIGPAHPVHGSLPTQVPVDTPSDISLLGTIADLTQAVETLIRVICDGEGGLEDVTELMPGLLAQYEPIAATKYRHAINTLIRERCQVKLSIDLQSEAIDAFWPSHTSNA